MSYETVIGLEIHAQLMTETKLFCSCPTGFGSGPNENTCPVCLGLPGSLPVLNEKTLELALRACLALNCKINKRSIFARKNYFYPDLPKGYQISQFDKPLAQNGFIEIKTENSKKRIGITRVHIEEDAGKLIHEGSDKLSLIDYNRSCIPLIEIVSEPDLRSSAEASQYLKTLRQVLIDNKICDGNLEMGNLRCDANLSVREKGDTKLGTKTELKNMNSFNFIQKALDYENQRHIEVIQEGKKITQETLLWDPKQNKTVTMRSKEQAHDYRYFEEPDLLPLTVQRGFITKVNGYFVDYLKKLMNIFSSTFDKKEIKKDLSVTRDEKILQTQKEVIESSPYILQETIKSYQEKILERRIKIQEKRESEFIKRGISSEQAKELNMYQVVSDFYYENKVFSKNPSQSATLITASLIPRLKEGIVDESQLPDLFFYFEEVNKHLTSGDINFNIAKEVIEESIESMIPPGSIIAKRGLKQISGTSEIDGIIDEVMDKCKQQVEQYRNGKEPLFHFLFGQVMKKTKGKVNPKVANERLKDKLKK